MSGTFFSFIASIFALTSIGKVSGCTFGEIRLVGGSSVNEGRVELCVNGTWGTVCDDDWNNAEASVVCVQLGYSSTGATAYRFASFGEGSGPIYLDEVACTGSETSLLSCPSNPIGEHDCSHYEDAGVACAGCTFGDIRLVGGSSINEGRVELCVNNTWPWGTVCDDLWDDDDASVVCAQLGYSPAGATAFSSAYFGQGSGAIYLDNVDCTGLETSLLSCPSNPIGVENCDHSEDAGVACAGAN